jgi:hypothetical protein
LAWGIGRVARGHNLDEHRFGRNDGIRRGMVGAVFAICLALAIQRLDMLTGEVVHGGMGIRKKRKTPVGLIYKSRARSNTWASATRTCHTLSRRLAFHSRDLHMPHISVSVIRMALTQGKPKFHSG